jgi:8-oxo-dGTP pyrophosphatase MutT (NUDIX family)
MRDPRSRSGHEIDATVPAGWRCSRRLAEVEIIERSVVRAVVLDVNRHVLLFHTRDPTYPELATWWELPGGGIDAGETYREAIIRELAEEAGIAIGPEQVGLPNWRRRASFRYRGQRRINDEVIVPVRLPVAAPPIDGAGRVEFEDEDYFDFCWWPVPKVIASDSRFYPGRLPQVIEPFLAGEPIDEPFEHWS